MKSKDKHSGVLQLMLQHAQNGNAADVNFIMSYLNNEASLAETRFVDYALSTISKPTGMEQIKYYLFHGTQIQRNYASLYFNRMGEWLLVKKAYSQGLIDEIQAFAR